LNRHTAATGLQNNGLIPKASRTPPVDRLTASFVPPRSAAISALALSNEVEEKHAARVAQLVTKTIMHLCHMGRLLYNADALVSTLDSAFELVTELVRLSDPVKGWMTAASATMSSPSRLASRSFSREGIVAAVLNEEGRAVVLCACAPMEYSIISDLRLIVTEAPRALYTRCTLICVASCPTSAIGEW
jgi:hypothetical protein